MINVNSYYNDSNEATGILNTLDAHETDAQFEDRKEKNRLLHLCKTKGFKHLEALGAKCGGIEKNADKKPATPKVKQRTREEWKEEMRQRAIKTLKMYKEDGMTLSSIGKALGINPANLRRDWRRFNLDAPAVKRSFDKDRLLDMVNNQGWSLYKACKSYGVHSTNVRRVMETAGWFYDGEQKKFYRKCQQA